MKVVKVFESDTMSDAVKESITTFLQDVKAIDPLSILPARYSIEHHQNVLNLEEAVKVMVDSQGVNALPIVCVNDVIIGMGSLPELDQIRKYINNASTAQEIDDCCGGGCCST